MSNILGGIAGDIIGSVYEWHNVKSYSSIEFFKPGCMVTDDSVLTCAVADWLVESQTNGLNDDESLKLLEKKLDEYGHRFENAGYGHKFFAWLNAKKKAPIWSYGNGAGMRVSPVGYFAKSENQCMKLAEMSATVTHNHPEGIKGAQAIAMCIYFARQKMSKLKIAERISKDFGYNLHHDISDYVTTDGSEYCYGNVTGRSHKFDSTCQTTVPEAIVAFLRSDSYEETIKSALMIGGDSDTIAMMAGSIAGAYYGVPSAIQERTIAELKKAGLYDTIEKFENLVANEGD